MKLQRRITKAPTWLAWEMQRRSETLASFVKADFHPMIVNLARPLRYPILAARTLAILMRKRPKLVYVQNPSIVLSALVCLLRPLFGYKVVMDRHSNFYVESRSSSSPKWRAFHALSRYSNRNADLTIVTNEPLKNVVAADGGRAYVLQDLLPDMTSSAEKPALQRPAAVFICTYSADEPVDEVIKAASMTTSGAHVYITGRPKLNAVTKDLLSSAGTGVTLTGFLSDADYKALIHSADLTVVLTSRENTLVCGAYESLACNKPVVLADTTALREYFTQGTVFCALSASAIARAIDESVQALPRLQEAAAKQKEWMTKDWLARYEGLQHELRTLTASS